MPKLVYSLDVLRLDSSRSSLSHLSSSMTFKNEAGQTNNSNSSPQSQTDKIAPRPRFVRRRGHSGHLAAPWAFPFPVESSSTRVSILIDDTNYAFEHPRNNSQISEEEHNRRRHMCPICLMRFRRPSDVHTHLNTHTGATREFL